jgi:glycosyltransferase involved in cell wall biosynthesis
MKNYFISVIIPVYNGEAYLAEAVESILRQNHEPLEIIIVDDGSTDNTAKIAAGLQGNFRYVQQSNSGPSAARNRGLKIAGGDLLGFLDADDLWEENKLKIQIEYFKKDPSLEIVLGFLQRMQLVSDKADPHVFKEWDQPVMNMHLGSGLFRKSVFDKVGCLDESLKYCEDWDWFMRAKEKNVPMLVHQDVTYYYRRHDQNITNDSNPNYDFALKMLRQSLNRRKGQGNGTASKLPRMSDLISGSEQRHD